MLKKTSLIMKSIGIGMVAGGMTAAMGSMMGSSSRKYKKMLNKAAKNAGDLIESVGDALGM